MFNVDDTIGIKCEVKPGPFSDEFLVTFETTSGPVTGFVDESELRQEDSQWYVRGIIKAVKKNTLEVWVEGSFFTTNGLANVPSELAVAA